MQFDLVSVFGTAGLGAVGLYVVGQLPPALRVGVLLAVVALGIAMLQSASLLSLGFLF
jgi:hypothetical protein